jgi:hypothetical protein
MYRVLLLCLTCIMLWHLQRVEAYDESECDAKAWRRIPPSGLFSTSRLLDAESYVAPLTGPARRVAIEKLKTASISEVTAQELRSLETKEPPRGIRAFFVRAIAYSLPSGNWSVRMVRDMLYIRHDSGGPLTIPLQCQPILVFLDHEPTDIFVGAILAR